MFEDWNQKIDTHDIEKVLNMHIWDTGLAFWLKPSIDSQNLFCHLSCLIGRLIQP